MGKNFDEKNFDEKNFDEKTNNIFDIINNPEDISFEEIEEAELYDDDAFEEIEAKNRFEQENEKNVYNVFDKNELPENDEVLKLTEYDGNADIQTNFVAAEYIDIDIVAVDKKHEKTAESFVSKIVKFIKEFNDITLTKEHKSYLEDVAKLQLSNLKDLLSLVTINKTMLENIVRRINAVQAEDYAMISAYNNLATQHLKLLKELQNTYRAVPSVLKKMRTEVLCDQELLEENKNSATEELVTSDYGSTQFNNTKQLLRTLREKNNNSQIVN